MSVLSSIENGLGKVAHVFVVGAAKLKSVTLSALKAVEGSENKVDQIEAIAQKIVDDVYPDADVVMQAIEKLTNEVFAGIKAADAGLSSLTVTFSPEATAAAKAALPVVEVQAETTPGS